MKIVIVNPVGSGLGHYTRSLEWVLTSVGGSVTVLTIDEPSASGQGRLVWLWEYCRILLEARRLRNGARVILAWPVIGYWDFVLSRVLVGRARVQLVIHDPEPLVRAAGYGWLARWVAGFSVVKAEPLVHSRTAADVVASHTVEMDAQLVPHPMLAPQEPTAKRDRPIVRVLGQYKPDRDIESLRRLAADSSHNWLFQIVGRGWAAIPGWDVSDRFMTESEFDALIRESAVVLVPYLRFFQSGVAIRCLELGTPIVGPHSSSLKCLVGPECAWLVRHGLWGRAVDAAVNASAQEIYAVAVGAYEDVLEQWGDWLRTLGPD